MRAPSRIDLGAWCDPEAAFLALDPGGDAVWLDSGPGATAGWSLLGFADAAAPRLVAARGEVVRHDAHGERSAGESVFAALAAAGAAPWPPPVAADGPPEGEPGPGWFGWFGYELGSETTGAPAAVAETPDAAWMRLDRVVVFDHARRTVVLRTAGSDDDAAWLSATAAALRALGAGPPVPPVSPAVPLDAVQVTARHSAASYRRRIERCRAAIAEGEAYQLCLVDEFRVRAGAGAASGGGFDPVAVHRRLRATSPAHHGGLLRIGGTSLVSASPEQFLAVDRHGRVTTRPIKGTRPRGADAAADRALADGLLASEKERAENLMIVDLMRNDLGRVAELGSVVVEALFALESYPQVHQLVSTVSARLAPGRTPLDAVRAAFPAGSMTGAPKRRAMELLHGLEGGPRGVYAGCFGRLGDDGTLDLAMVIRSIVLTPGQAVIGAGGGITALSDPDEEVEEVRVKARALLAALGAAGIDPFGGAAAS